MASRNFRVFKDPIMAIGIACLAGVLTACAFGQKISYSNTKAAVAASGTDTVALATWDRRPYVVSGHKGPSFVGVNRSALGIPYNVDTKNGEPLADDFSQSIRKSLDARGFKTTIVKTRATESHRAVMHALHARKAERAVLVTLNQWETDKYLHTNLDYQVEITVYASDGRVMTRQSFAHSGEVGNVRAAFEKDIAEWFSSPKIVAALK